MKPKRALFGWPSVLRAVMVLVAASSPVLAQTDPNHMALYDDCTFARVIAETAAHDLMTILGGELRSALAEGGPAAAIDVCSRRAQAITDSLSQAHAVRLRRVSERYRNPADTPTDTERAILARFTEEDAPADTIFAVGEGEERAYLYMRPIRIDKLVCLRCHGSTERIPTEVRQAIRERYPDDRATGFEFDDLRGAFSVRVPRDTYLRREAESTPPSD